MKRDHRPYAVKRAYRKFENFYVNHFIRPQLACLGPGYTFMRPWHVEVFGDPIEIGKCVNVIATPDMRVRLSVWSDNDVDGRISVGDYCLICPGVRIGSAKEIIIEDNCMLASGAYIMDSDWHDLYNRIIPSRKASPILIKQNAWIGDHATICKGVTIGENSVIGAGAVVVTDIPPNTIAAGNPARVVKELDPDAEFVTRAKWFENPEKLSGEIKKLDRLNLQRNTLRHWFRHLLFPSRED